MTLVDFSTNLNMALSNILNNYVSGLASLIVVIVFLGIGYLVAKFFAQIVERGLKEMRLEKKLEQKGVHDALGTITVTEIISVFVRLATFTIFLGVAANVTDLPLINTLILWIFSYIPSLVEGTIIIVVALLAVDYVSDRFRKSKEVPFANLMAILLKVFVAYTAVVIALPLILPGADVSILRDFFILMVGAFAVAVGLGSAIALGLGLKDVVRDVGKKKEKHIEKLLS